MNGAKFPLKVGGLAACAVMSAAMADMACLILSDPFDCCVDRVFQCTGGAAQWPCTDTVVPGSGGPFEVHTSLDAPPETAGRRLTQSTNVGTCQIVRRKCGAGLNECDYLTTSTTTCVDVNLAGQACQGIPAEP